jgi:hypothetical protein
MSCRRPTFDLERIEWAIARRSTARLLWQFSRMCQPAIEHGHFVSATEGILHLKRSGEAGAAENQNT